jgi:uncharacterized membrane protein YjgN (DUF898 family)
MDFWRNGQAGEERHAIGFTGNWREFLPIAATNVLLIIVTLGVYRFWAAARERRYLWSRTRVIDDTLEWTGTGKEMFLGFLLVIAALLPFFLFVQFAFPALLARGHEALAAAMAIAFYLAFFWLIGLATFRATRYRLTRTWWHGIRGGSDDSGMRFAANYIGRYALCLFTGFLLFPWATTSLWNKRWERMSFGPYAFKPYLSSNGLWGRWLLIYLLPVGVLLVTTLLGGVLFAVFAGGTGGGLSLGIGAIVIALLVVVYLAVPLATLHWYAKFFRHAAGTLTLGELQFGFEARTRDWLFLFLGNLALAVGTLGLGIAFWGYRNWAFMARHARLYGKVDLAELTQSSTHAPRESEGFADAFDMGAI